MIWDTTWRLLKIFSKFLLEWRIWEARESQILTQKRKIYSRVPCKKNECQKSEIRKSHPIKTSLDIKPLINLFIDHNSLEPFEIFPIFLTSDLFAENLLVSNITNLTRFIQNVIEGIFPSSCGKTTLNVDFYKKTTKHLFSSTHTIGQIK